MPVGAGQLTPTVYVQDKGKYTFNNFTLWNKTKSLAIWTPGEAAYRNVLRQREILDDDQSTNGSIDAPTRRGIFPFGFGSSFESGLTNT